MFPLRDTIASVLVLCVAACAGAEPRSIDLGDGTLVDAGWFATYPRFTITSEDVTVSSPGSTFLFVYEGVPEEEYRVRISLGPGRENDTSSEAFNERTGYSSEEIYVKMYIYAIRLGKEEPVRSVEKWTIWPSRHGVTLIPKNRRQALVKLSGKIGMRIDIRLRNRDRLLLRPVLEGGGFEF